MTRTGARDARSMSRECYGAHHHLELWRCSSQHGCLWNAAEGLLRHRQRSHHGDYMGALQTGATPFERAIRIRQTALAQTQQAIAEDRIARAGRTRPHQLQLGELTAGTSEVEFCREVKGDPGWRGPALLLRVDEKDGTAVQYQGKPYLVSLRHIRPFQGIFMVGLQTEDVETSLHHLMRYVESLADYKIYLIGWLKKKNGM